MGVLENTIREELNLSAGRIMGVLDPLKITITNYSENEQEIIQWLSETYSLSGASTAGFDRVDSLWSSNYWAPNVKG